MLIALPALCFVLILFYLLHRRAPETNIRSVVLTAAVVWGMALAAITELLSGLNVLTASALGACWAIVAGSLAAASLMRRASPVPRWERPPIPSPFALAVGLSIAAIVVGSGVSAAAGWPNQWDSMVYHLSRVDHWIQDRSVAFYPTHIVRQLYNPPWAEYAVLHLSVLGGSEHWANAPQWLSMVGSVIGVTVIAQRLGAGARGQLFAALFCATIPMGILQASGAQNDYVVAFWLVCLVDAILSPPSLTRAFQIGGSLGLALLTKGTALLYGAPLVCLAPLFVSTTRNTASAWATRAIRGACILLIAVALNAAHWTRNINAFGSPLGPRLLGSADGVADKLTNDALTPGILASNLVRNLSLHAGTPFKGMNLALENAIERGHALLGLDVDDPRSSRLYPLDHFEIPSSSNDPDQTGNPLHLLLILATAARIGLVRSTRRSPAVMRYGLVLATAFVAFCLVLKWQPWHSRLHLPLFVLAAPLVGVTWERSFGLMASASVLFVMLAVSPLLRNRLAPLVSRRTVLNTPRMEQYFQTFKTGPNAKQRTYVAAARLIKARDCHEVGLLLGWDDWEHPLWVLLQQQGREDGGMVQHVGVANGSARMTDRAASFTPCAVVAGNVQVGDSFELHGRPYRPAWSGDGLTVLLPSSPP
jgi:hypothetical protein